jgi:hypothetical protein
MPDRRTSLLLAALVVPPLVLAAVGVTHPSELDASSAEYWRNLHIGILVVFPLLGFAPWLVVRGRYAWLSWTAGVLGFVYAAFYSALDILAGIGAGALEHAGHHDAIGTAFRFGDGIGIVGSVAFVGACALAGGLGVRMLGARGIPGAVLVVAGSVLFLYDHIFFPLGVVGQLALAAGWVLLALPLRRITPAG